MASIVDTTAKVAGGKVGDGSGVTVLGCDGECVTGGVITAVPVNSTNISGVGCELQEARTTITIELM